MKQQVPFSTLSTRQSRSEQMSALTNCPGSEEMLHLLTKRVGVELSHDDFRETFEEIYNFRLDLEKLPPHAREALSQFFDLVSRYSPLASDRIRYPGVYNDEKRVDEALEALREQLDIRAN